MSEKHKYKTGDSVTTECCDCGLRHLWVFKVTRGKIKSEDVVEIDVFRLSVGEKMAKAKIIKEDSVQRLKQFMLENIERLDAELVVLDTEAKQEREHNRNGIILKRLSDRLSLCNAKRDIYHYCLCEIQRNITEIEI